VLSHESTRVLPHAVSRHLNRPVKQARPIGHGDPFGECLPLMEDTTMRVESFVMAIQAGSISGTN
jgi:hypothetical protein